MSAKDDTDRAVKENAALAVSLQRAWEGGNVAQAKWLLEKQIQHVTVLRLNLFSMEGSDADE